MDFDDQVVEEAARLAGNSQLFAEKQSIVDVILSRSDATVLAAFEKRCQAGSSSGGQAALDYTRALYYFLLPIARDNEFSRAAKLLVLVVVHVIELVISHTLVVDKKVIDCLSFFIQEMGSLPQRLLPSVVEAVISNLEMEVGQDYGSILDLLPTCLTIIMTSVDSVLVPGEQGQELQMSGREYRDHVVTQLLHIPWAKALLTRMASIIRELPLDLTQVEDLLKKLLGHMEEVEPQALPSLVYQLLLLASHGHKRIVVTGIMSFFSKLQGWTLCGLPTRKEWPQTAIDAYRQVEGTVVLHINFAVKQDSALGLEWLTVVRMGSGSLTPFTVCVLLSLAQIQRFEQPCFDLLKVAAVKSYQDCEHCRESVLASSILGPLSSRIAKAMEQSFMWTVENSAFGWDHMIPSVVQMGFILIESGAAIRYPFGEDGIRIESESESQQLGLQLLSAAFEVHEMARDEIIEQSKLRLIGLKPQQSVLIVRMLALLVQKHPQHMLMRSACLKKCLDYLTFLPSSSAAPIVQALCPLFQLSRDLQDYTILMLRKSMFGREASNRMVAVQGLLDLIIAEKQNRTMNDADSESWHRMSSSEASCSQPCSQMEPRHGRYGHSRRLLREVFGLLQRCLLQQVCVREALYKRLPSVLIADPTSAEEVFDLLWPHFQQFYEEGEGDTVNLKLSECVATRNNAAYLEEPFDHLLACIHQLLLLQPQERHAQQASDTGETCEFAFSEDQLGQLSSGELLGAAFCKIRKNVRSSSLGDFKLDKTQNFAVETVEGEKKLEEGRLFLGVLEVLMDAAVAELTQKDCEGRQMDIKDEVKVYLVLHDSLHQIVNQKQHTKASATAPAKAGPTGKILNPKPRRASQSRGTPGPAKQTRFAVPKAILEKRVSFSSSACIAYLLQTIADQDINSGCDASSFVLRLSLRHLKAVANECFIEKENPNNLSGTFTGPFGREDWKLIASPLLEFISSFKFPSVRVGSSTVKSQEKVKGGKAKKSSEDSGEGPILIAVNCLDELCKIATYRGSFIEVLLSCTSDSDAEHNSGDPPESRVGLIEKGRFEGADAQLLHHWLQKHIQPLMRGLLADSCFCELAVVAKTLLFLGKKLPPSMMKQHAAWAEAICKEFAITNGGAVCAMASLAVCLNTVPEDFKVAIGLSSELLKVMGFEEVDPIDSSEVYPILNVTTKNAMARFLLQHCENTLKDMEWLIGKIKIIGSVKLPGLRFSVSGLSDIPRRFQLEEVLHTRVEAVMLTLSDFSTMCLTGLPAEQFLKVATHLYKCLAASTKLCIATKGCTQAVPSTRFQKLAEVTCKRLTAPLYLFMATMQRDQQENQTEKGSFSKIKREGKTIPNLIYHIEDYERYLIQLSRVSKVNLMRHAKRSTARDFKIIVSNKKSKPVAHRSEDDRPVQDEAEEENDPNVDITNHSDGEEETQETREEAEEEIMGSGVPEAEADNRGNEDNDEEHEDEAPSSPGSREVPGSGQRRRGRIIEDSDPEDDSNGEEQRLTRHGKKHRS